MKLKIYTKHGILITTLVAALFASLITSMLQTRVMAAGSIYLTPASQTTVVNNNLTVNLRINPGTPVTVVQATVNFDPAKLQYVSINSSNSPFDASVQQTVGGSSIQISRAKLDANGISTDSLIASITFKALPSSGSSSITLSNANAAFNGTYTNPGASGATVTFSPGSCPSGQTGTPPNCITPAAPTQTKPSTTKPTTTAPSTTTPTTPKPTESQPAPTSEVKKTVVSVPSITKQSAAYTNVVIDATTEQDVQVFVRYGTDKETLNIQSPLTALGKAHSITLDQGLTPGTALFYAVVAQGAQGVTAQTEVQSLQTKGLSLKLALLAQNLVPLRNQEVTIEPLGITVKSDKDGFATFDSLPPGDFTVSVTYDGVKYSQHVGVVSNVETENGVQTSAVLGEAIVYTGLQPRATSLLQYWPVAVALLVLIAAAVLFIIWPQWLKGLLNKLPFGPKSYSPTAYPDIVAFGSATAIDVAPQETIVPQDATVAPAVPTEPIAPTNTIPTPYEPAPWEKPPQQRGPF